ncbi:MAG TPA: hypothetical protein VGD65_23115 [Chryseosolibacter sp.]
MEIGRKFSNLTLKECLFYIENYRKYTDFNTLGLYRSIIENEKLSVDEKIQLREFAHGYFRKFFDFLQLKDPCTFVKVSTLGEELTVGDESQLWRNVVFNQERILKDKRIKHRNFGKYSRHECGYPDCPYKGLMITQHSHLAEIKMHFESDKNRYAAQLKSERRRMERKSKRVAIRELVLDEQADWNTVRAVNGRTCNHRVK